MNILSDANLLALTEQSHLQAVLRMNAHTQIHGLTLSPRQAQALIAAQRDARRSAGRIAFGGGIVPELIQAFASSPLLTRKNYALTLCELTELVEQIKTETADTLGDATLLRFLRTRFDTVCGGSMELLAQREAERVIRAFHAGVRDPLAYVMRDTQEDESNA